MSRIGKLPIAVPAGVTVGLNNGVVTVKGAKGQLNYSPRKGVKVIVESSKILVTADVDGDAQLNADWGATRAHLNNMVVGVTQGFKKTLELNGVGFTAKLQGQTLVLAVGFSHDVKIDVPKEVKCAVTKNTIDLESFNKDVIGALAAEIRGVKPPEPYLGKGIKYSDEVVRRKAGKTGKK